MVIYLVPHLENENELHTDSETVKHDYEWANERIKKFKKIAGCENE